MKNKPILKLINEHPNRIMDNSVNELSHDNIEPTYHRRHSVSNSHFYDVIGNESFFDSEPTIIDAIKYLIRKCCCCSKCSNMANYNYEIKSNKWDYSIEDEVEKAMRERRNNNFELQTSFLENNKSRNSYTKDYEMLADKSISSTSEPKPRFFKKDKSGARMRCYCIPCLTYKPRVWQLNTLTLIIQFLCITIMGSIELIQNEQQYHRSRVSLGTLIGIMWFFQLIIMIQVLVICIKRLWQLTFFEIIQLYITSIIMFTGVYTTAYFYDHAEKKLLGTFQAFNLGDTEFRDSDYWSRFIAFFYFSCSQQTLCGVCEIIPKSPPTQILAAIQMLCGIFFSIIIISIGISRVGEDLEKRHNEIEHNDDDNESIMIENRTCWSSLTHKKKIRYFRRTIREFLLLIVLIIQICKNLVEWVTTDSSFANKYNALHSIIYIIFDVLNIFVVIMTSLKFLHIGHMTELKLSFLCQTYLSCMLIFAGIYVDLQVSSNGYNNGAFITGEDTYLGMWTIFLYFSFAIMTLCGAGLDIKPKTSYATIAVCIEMLIGLFFHVYIFGTGLLLLANKKFKTNRKEKEFKRLESIAGNNNNNNNNNIDDNNNDIAGSELIMLTLLQER